MRIAETLILTLLAFVAAFACAGMAVFMLGVYNFFSALAGLASLVLAIAFLRCIDEFLRLLKPEGRGFPVFPAKEPIRRPEPADRARRG